MTYISTNQQLNYTQIGNDLAKGIKKQAKNEGKIIDKIGTGYNNAKEEYFSALAKGDQAAIAKAQDKYQSFTLAMRAAVEFISNKFHIMMNIISKLSLR